MRRLRRELPRCKAPIRIASLLALLWLFAGVPGASANPAAGGSAPDGELPPPLLAAVSRIASEEQAPAVQLAALRGGRIVWSTALGLADVENASPATPTTIFRAGSVSKLFTAVLVMRQVERGVLGLDDDVNAHLPPERRIRDPDGREVRVTIRELLSHRSGLPLLGAGAGTLRTVGFLLGILGEPSLDAYLAHGLVLRKMPGETLRYSDDGYILLGWLCAQLSGVPFPEQVRRDLLEPLGTSESDFDRAALPPERAIATPYQVDGGSWKRAREYATPWPSGGLYTTALDLLQLARMVLGDGELAGRRILARQSLADMTRLQATLAPGLESGFGLGFRITQRRGVPLLCHEGEIAGGAARLCIARDAEIAVSVLANVGNLAAAIRISNRLLDELLGAGEPAARPPADARELEGWTGRYHTVRLLPDALRWVEPFVASPVTLRGGSLHVEIPGFGAAILRPTGEPGRFVVEGGAGDGETLVFRKEADGRIHGYVAIVHLLRSRF